MSVAACSAGGESHGADPSSDVTKNEADAAPSGTTDSGRSNEDSGRSNEDAGGSPPASPLDAGTPSVLSSVQPSVPTKATGADAIVRVSPAVAGWTAHWMWSGPAAAVAGDVQHLGAIAKSEKWTLRAWADGPGGARVDAEDVAFNVGNSLPGAGAVMISPNAPRTGDSLLAAWQTPPSDIDGDPLSFSFLWEKNGGATTFSENTVPAATIRGPETWRVRARAVETNDPSQVGPEAIAEVQVGRLPPTAPVVAITPSPAKVGQALQASILADAMDPNGEPLTYVYGWTRNGSPAFITGPTVPSSGVMPHDTWIVSVHARNTALAGPAAQASTTVANRFPSPGVATLGTPPFTAESKITAQTSSATDPDGDALSIAYAWTVNGVPVAGATSQTLNVGSFKRGDVVEAIVTWNDGYGGTATTSTAPVTITNAIPKPPTALAFAPPFPRGSDDARLTATNPAVDADGDPVSTRRRWRQERSGPTMYGHSISRRARGRSSSTTESARRTTLWLRRRWLPMATACTSSARTRIRAAAGYAKLRTKSSNGILRRANGREPGCRAQD